MSSNGLKEEFIDLTKTHRDLVNSNRGGGLSTYKKEKDCQSLSLSLFLISPMGDGN